MWRHGSLIGVPKQWNTSVVANLDLREDVCYGSVTSSGCDKPYGGRYKKVDCCCSVVGGGWGNPCQECPLENTGNTKRKSQSVLSQCFPSNFSLQAGLRLAQPNQTPPGRNALLADFDFDGPACDVYGSLLAGFSNLYLFYDVCLNYPPWRVSSLHLKRDGWKLWI